VKQRIRAAGACLVETLVQEVEASRFRKHPAGPGALPDTAHAEQEEVAGRER
jgi:hypothetical protein